MDPLIPQRLRISGGTDLSFVAAGDRSDPAVVLIHGFPSSWKTFRRVVPELSRDAYVVAPDLPGFGASGVLAEPSFARFATAIVELLDHLRIGPRFIYLHDFGAPVGLRIAMDAPDQVLGLIIQNANAHRTGFGPQWTTTIDCWSDPSPDNEAEATAHLTLEGTRDQYTAGVPADIADRISAARWEEDWRVMTLPGRLDTQRALIADYGRYVERFDDVAAYLDRWQPPALLLWGRHDAFFDIAEVRSWMEDLPRMEAHILDGGHFPLETHADVATGLIRAFVEIERGGGQRHR